MPLSDPDKFTSEAIARLDIKDGDIILFDPSMIDTSKLMEMCIARYQDDPAAPTAWFFPVKLYGGKKLRDCVEVVSGANFTVVEKRE